MTTQSSDLVKLPYICFGRNTCEVVDGCMNSVMKSSIAQLVERTAVNRKVASSNLAGGVLFWSFSLPIWWSENTGIYYIWPTVSSVHF